VADGTPLKQSVAANVVSTWIMILAPTAKVAKVQVSVCVVAEIPQPVTGGVTIQLSV